MLSGISLYTAVYKVHVVFAIICSGLLLVLFAIKLMNVVVGIMGIILDCTKEKSSCNPCQCVCNIQNQQ